MLEFTRVWRSHIFEILLVRGSIWQAPEASNLSLPPNRTTSASRPTEGATVDAAAWDERYSGAELVWGSGPNQFVAAELGELPAGRALDVACGEGRNAIWLASRGWQTIGVDFSPAAVRRAERLAADAGVTERAKFLVIDVVNEPLPPGPFDAVIVAYLQVAEPARRVALRRAAAGLAPGGILLVVAHDASNIEEGFGGPQDPTVLFTVGDVLGDLSDHQDLVSERAQRVRRTVDTPQGERVAIDLLVRLRREDS